MCSDTLLLFEQPARRHRPCLMRLHLALSPRFYPPEKLGGFSSFQLVVLLFVYSCEVFVTNELQCELDRTVLLYRTVVLEFLSGPVCPKTCQQSKQHANMPVVRQI